MSFADRIFTGLRTIVLIEERVANLTKTVEDIKFKSEETLANHESRLTRLETIIEITRSDGATLRLAPK